MGGSVMPISKITDRHVVVLDALVVLSALMNRARLLDLNTYKQGLGSRKESDPDLEGWGNDENELSEGLLSPLAKRSARRLAKARLSIPAWCEGIGLRSRLLEKKLVSPGELSDEKVKAYIKSVGFGDKPNGAMQAYLQLYGVNRELLWELYLTAQSLWQDLGTLFEEKAHRKAFFSFDPTVDKDLTKAVKKLLYLQDKVTQSFDFTDVFRFVGLWHEHPLLKMLESLMGFFELLGTWCGPVNHPSQMRSTEWGDTPKILVAGCLANELTFQKRAPQKAKIPLFSDGVPLARNVSSDSCTGQEFAGYVEACPILVAGRHYRRASASITPESPLAKAFQSLTDSSVFAKAAIQESPVQPGTLRDGNAVLEPIEEYLKFVRHESPVESRSFKVSDAKLKTIQRYRHLLATGKIKDLSVCLKRAIEDEVLKQRRNLWDPRTPCTIQMLQYMLGKVSCGETVDRDKLKKKFFPERMLKELNEKKPYPETPRSDSSSSKKMERASLLRRRNVASEEPTFG
ncbi:MAG: hypothetical protein EBX40_00980 [Gammaproteobacteria bacterium]|nr:hypothetical protein [Gammaproteobacteria bacterium]